VKELVKKNGSLRLRPVREQAHVKKKKKTSKERMLSKRQIIIVVISFNLKR